MGRGQSYAQVADRCSAAVAAGRIRASCGANGIFQRLRGAADGPLAYIAGVLISGRNYVPPALIAVAINEIVESIKWARQRRKYWEEQVFKTKL